MPNTKLSRRNFLKVTGIALGSATLLCAGLGYASSAGPGVDTPHYRYGEGNSVDKRILVTYATRAGSTVEVAGAIAKTLAGLGFNVDVRPAKEMPSIEGYRALVSGSAVREHTWLPEALDFIKSNRSVLTNIPVFFYTMHLSNLDNDEKSRAKRLANLEEARSLVEPKDAAFFAGKLDYSRLSLLDRVSYSKGEKDLRDWQAIRNWVAGLAGLL